MLAENCHELGGERDGGVVFENVTMRGRETSRQCLLFGTPFLTPFTRAGLMHAHRVTARLQ